MLLLKCSVLLYFAFASLCVFIEANETDHVIEFLVQKIEKLEKRNGDMERKIENMEKDFRMHEMTMTQRISRLERQNYILRRDNDNREELRKEMKHDNVIQPAYGKESDTEDIKVTRKTKTMIMEDSEIQRTPCETGNRRIRSTPEMEVAFFATATQHDVVHLGLKQNIVFNKAFTNIGNAYHTTHGIFTAPVAGTYIFSATVSGTGEYYANFDVNGNEIAMFLTHAHEQSSHMIVLQLKAGDDVSVKNDRGDGHILGAHFSSFSGFLLYQSF